MPGEKDRYDLLRTSSTAVDLFAFMNGIPKELRDKMELAVDRYAATNHQHRAPDEISAIADFSDVPEVIAKLYKLDVENWAQIAQGRPIDDLHLRHLVSVAVSTDGANDARGFFKNHGATPNRTLFERFFDEPFDTEPLSVKLSATAIARAQLQVQKMSDSDLRAVHKSTSDAIAPYERGLVILNKELSNRTAPESTKTVFPEMSAASSRTRKGRRR